MSILGDGPLLCTFCGVGVGLVGWMAGGLHDTQISAFNWSFGHSSLNGSYMPCFG